MTHSTEGRSDPTRNGAGLLDHDVGVVVALPHELPDQLFADLRRELGQARVVLAYARRGHGVVARAGIPRPLRRLRLRDD